MPRFFFDLQQVDTVMDLGSAEFEDTEMAREYAIGLAQSIFSDQSSPDPKGVGSIKIHNVDNERVGVVEAGMPRS